MSKLSYKMRKDLTDILMDSGVYVANGTKGKSMATLIIEFYLAQQAPWLSEVHMPYRAVKSSQPSSAEEHQQEKRTLTKDIANLELTNAEKSSNGEHRSLKKKVRNPGPPGDDDGDDDADSDDAGSEGYRNSKEVRHEN